MIINRIKKIPKKYSVRYDSTELLRDDLEDLKSLGLDEIWYWYGEGNCEGDGQLLMRKGNKYEFSTLSHCSCNEPLDNINVHVFNGSTLEELKNKCSKEYYLTDLKILFNEAKRRKNENNDL